MARSALEVADLEGAVEARAHHEVELGIEAALGHPVGVARIAVQPYGAGRARLRLQVVAAVHVVEGDVALVVAQDHLLGLHLEVLPVADAHGRGVQPGELRRHLVAGGVVEGDSTVDARGDQTVGLREVLAVGHLRGRDPERAQVGEGTRVPHAHGAVARVRYELFLLRDGQHAPDHVAVVQRLRVGVDPHRPEVLVEGVLVAHLVRAVGHVRGRLRLEQHVVCELIPVDGAVAVGVNLHEEVRQLLVREVLAEHLAKGLEELVHVQAAAAVDVSAVERRLELHELMQVDPVLDAAGVTLAVLLAVFATLAGLTLVWLWGHSSLWGHRTASLLLNARPQLTSREGAQNRDTDCR